MQLRYAIIMYIAILMYAIHALPQAYIYAWTEVCVGWSVRGRLQQVQSKKIRYCTIYRLNYHNISFKLKISILYLCSTPLSQKKYRWFSTSIYLPLWHLPFPLHRIGIHVKSAWRWWYWIMSWRRWICGTVKSTIDEKSKYGM